MHRYKLFFLILFFINSAIAQSGQIAIPRVDMMPNQPSPYDMRDWKTAAFNYDSFVYDINLTGQYLPLTTIIPAGVNYPQNQSFRQHTYVGTNSPLGNESINVLPSLVGASLVGIDKSNQFGKNWVLMSQDFFNKNNGENLYLNNPATTSGNDWWYDMMPNVYFYQLYDLYPNMGGDADYQFTAIADRFATAVGQMGGDDAPWQPAYMNYRAWKFKSGEPNTTSVPEPEAAGPFAWVLYNAWKESQNPDYLKAAEWSMEFLDEWTSNPSYELQLPYGTLTAAKMNAELGTEYDIEKMINWSFDKGELRGWGTIVGTWGGLNVSGLIGEANDVGNDYAFQMNGYQQAAALVPMVRYDKRFAHAIGKWVLNLANASRLYFSNYLPANKQDSEAWSDAHDPNHAIGYEALKQVYQGNSPYATGDAINGGWAATNLALYGTSSIGYLGAIVEQTNVDKILKINVLATDFYNDDAYPTYLYYNSYSTAKNVQLDAGTASVDIYEALSEQFTHQNVNGTVSFVIPPNSAIMVTLCPAGGAVTYDKNKMLVDGVVVDFRQSQVPFTYSPRFKALAAANSPVEINATTTLYATISDADSDQFTYQWSASVGSISGAGEQVSFTAPASTGEATIQCIVSDPQGNSDSSTLQLPIVLEINEAPQILEIHKDTPYTSPNGSIQLTAIASDPDLDPLTYIWSTTGGTIVGTGASVQWNAPISEGIYQVTVQVADDQGLSAQTTTSLLVKTFTASSGNIIADYPFNGNPNDVSGNNLHGQVNGASLTADVFGQPQRAYYFNGGSQNISVPNNPILNFQDGITASCWFKPAALPEKESFILSHGSWQGRWKISISPDRRLRWTVNTMSTIGDLDATFPLALDSFYHLAVTYTNGFMAMYVNGVLHSYKTLNGQIRQTSAPFLMGQMLPGETGYNFNGTIDDVKIYDYALTPDAVAELYQQDATAVGEAVSEARKSMLLQPNPVTDLLNITAPFVLKQLRVTDVAGRVVWEKNDMVSSIIELNVNTWQSGIYFANGVGEKGVVSAKFYKK